MVSQAAPSTRSASGCIGRFAVTLFGLLLALFVAEFGIRLIYPRLPMGLQIALRNVRVNPFSEDRIAPPSLWQDDKDYLTIVRPGAVDSLQAGSPTVTFRVSTYSWWGGRVGFRSPQPTDGDVQAVAVGDSFTFCFTDASDCWVNVAAQVSGLDIANLGQPVTGSTSHARIFFDYVAKPELNLKQPQVVLWQFYGNDNNDDFGLADLNGTAKSPTEPATSSRPLPTGAAAMWLRENSVIYSLISTLLRGKDPGVEKFVDPYHVTKDGIDLWFGQSYVRDAFDMSLARNQEGEALSQQAIVDTRQIVEKNGGEFIIVVMPAKEEVYRALSEPIMGKPAVDAISMPRLRLLEFCKTQKLTCLDLLPPLQELAESGKQVYFSADPHLNALGNQIAGETVASYLMSQSMSK
jgi:hypothetical protein